MEQYTQIDVFESMVNMATSRGQLFMFNARQIIVTIDPPVTCNHHPHPTDKMYVMDDGEFFLKESRWGDLFFAAGLNAVGVISSDGSTEHVLIYDVENCRPMWLPQPLAGSWMLMRGTAQPKWELVHSSG